MEWNDLPKSYSLSIESTTKTKKKKPQKKQVNKKSWGINK